MWQQNWKIKMFPDFQEVLRLQHQVCIPERQKYLFKSTSTEQRLSTPTPWCCLVSDQNQDATEQAHLWGHLGGSIILSPRHTPSSIDTDNWYFMSWRGRHCDNTTSSHGYICHSDSSWCGCLCPARTLLSHVHGFTSLTTSKHWHCWDHCQDRRHSWGSSSYSCPQWVWYGGGNIWHWGTDSNQRGERGSNPCPLWVMPLPISPTDIASQATEFITTYGKHVEGRTTMADCRQKF